MQILNKYKSNIEHHLQGLAKKLSWLNPNIVTIIGIIPSILFVIFMSNHQWWWAVVMLILTPLDMLDGILARANNKVTAFGGFLDSTIDRIADFLIICGLYLGGIASLKITTLLILFSFLISYTRSRAELASRNNIKFNYGFMERAERIIFIILIVLLHLLYLSGYLPTQTLPQTALYLLVILSLITFLQRVYYAYKKL